MQDIQLRRVTTEPDLTPMFYQRWLVLRAPLGMPLGTERDRHDDDAAIYLVAIAPAQSANQLTDQLTDQLTHQLTHQIIGSARLHEVSPGTGSILCCMAGPFEVARCRIVLN